MSLIAIVRPLTFAIDVSASSAGSGLTNLLTPNPREAFVASAAGYCHLMLDFGSEVQIDTVFVGYTNAVQGAALTLYRGLDMSEVLWAGTFLHSYRSAPMRHGRIVLAALPSASRYYRVRCASAAAPFVAGILAAGVAIRPGKDAALPGTGVEAGAGRPIADTGRADRLIGGGFGIQPGVAAPGFQFTLPSLSDDERERLYALHLDLGGTSPVLVIEDPDAVTAANEGVHWGYWTKFEPYARQAPGETKWAMQVQDWA